MVNDITQEFLSYLKEQDRAVTLDEISDHTSISDTIENYEQLRDDLTKLESEDYITSDIVLTDSQALKQSTRFYPTNKLFSEPIETITL